MATITYKVTVATGTNKYGTGNKFYINGELLMLSYIYKKAILTYLINLILVTIQFTKLLFLEQKWKRNTVGAYTTGVTSTGTPGNCRSKN